MKRYVVRASERPQFDNWDEGQPLLWTDSQRCSEDGNEPRKACIDQPPRCLRIGDAVTVFTLGHSGPSIEGIGTIESYDAAPHRYHIIFAGERIAKLRFINPDWQADPERSLLLLVEFWRSQRSDNPTIEDFFPEDNG